MAHFDKELNVYAENGLRTTQDWLTLGRQVQPGQSPRSEANSRGRAVQLFSRDQTQRVVSRRPSARASQHKKGPTAATAAAPE